PGFSDRSVEAAKLAGRRHPHVSALFVAREVFYNREQQFARTGDLTRTDLADGNPIYFLGQRYKFPAQAAALRREKDIDLLAIPGLPAAHDITEAFHRLYGRKGRRLHHAGLLTEFALR